jgi:hypothetical protein
VVVERDVDLLKHVSGPIILIKPLAEFNILSDTEVILQLTGAGSAAVMVESPQYFTAFRHVLDTLQASLGRILYRVQVCYPDVSNYHKNEQSVCLVLLKERFVNPGTFSLAEEIGSFGKLVLNGRT